MKVTVIQIVTRMLGTIPKGLTIGGRNYSIVKISENTEKGPGDLRRLAVTQTHVKDHQLTLV